LADYSLPLKKILRDEGFYFKESGKGSHEIWTDGSVKVTVPNKVERTMANVILKQTGSSYKFR
jgi:predicted RNA binding protein YcfA (HicA-like mRNA interferase family)